MTPKPGIRDSYLTHCVIGSHRCTRQIISKPVKRFQQAIQKDDEQANDRPTDHAAEKCVAIGEIVCGRAIPPKKHKKDNGLNLSARELLHYLHTFAGVGTSVDIDDETKRILLRSRQATSRPSPEPSPASSELGSLEDLSAAAADDKAKELGVLDREVHLQETDPVNFLEFGSEIWRYVKNKKISQRQLDLMRGSLSLFRRFDDEGQTSLRYVGQ